MAGPDQEAVVVCVTRGMLIQPPLGKGALDLTLSLRSPDGGFPRSGDRSDIRKRVLKRCHATYSSRAPGAVPNSLFPVKQNQQGRRPVWGLGKLQTRRSGASPVAHLEGSADDDRPTVRIRLSGPFAMFRFPALRLRGDRSRRRPAGHQRRPLRLHRAETLEERLVLDVSAPAILQLFESSYASATQ